MSDALVNGGAEARDAEDAGLLRSYQSAMDAWERGELPGFTSEDEFLDYAASRT